MATATTDIHPELPSRSFERILLIKPSSLGDVIHALPVLHGLRQRFPGAAVDWLVASAFAPLLEGHSMITRLVPFDRRRYGRMTTSPRASAEFLRFVADLRRRRYDLVIDLQGLFRSGFLAWCTRASIRIGFVDAREAARLFYTHRIRPPRGDIHAVDKNYLVAGPLGFASVPIRFDLGLDAELGRSAADLLKAHELPTNRPLVAVAPGARWETKRWPADRFAATMKSLRAAQPCDFILIGGQDEAETCARLTSACTPPPVNLAGKTGLKELSALMARADVILCHDSGVAHLAVALNRPLVCLTGPTNPLRTGPYGRLHDVLRLDLPCAPCYFRTRAQCPHHHRCMQELGVEQVVDALRRRIGRAPDGSRSNVSTGEEWSMNR